MATHCVVLVLGVIRIKHKDLSPLRIICLISKYGSSLSRMLVALKCRLHVMHLHGVCMTPCRFITCYCEHEVRSQEAWPDCAFMTLVSINFALQHSKHVLCLCWDWTSPHLSVGRWINVCNVMCSAVMAHSSDRPSNGNNKSFPFFFFFKAFDRILRHKNNWFSHTTGYTEPVICLA